MAKLPAEQTNKRGITVDGKASSTFFCVYFITGLTDHLRMNGANGHIFAIGDCTASSYAPTAQVASQQGAYLARVLALMARRDTLEARLASLEADTVAGTAVLAGENGSGGGGEHPEERKKVEEEIQKVKSQISKVKLKPFHYSHQGSLA
jgi:NADH:ubiquinone reductase (non-electrogenic)